MAAPGQGNQSFLQIGLEATWATAVAATKRLTVNRIRPRPAVGMIRSRRLQNVAVQPAIYQGGIVARGSIEGELSYEDMGLLIDGVMGTATYGIQGAVDTGAGPFTHVYRNRQIFNSHTLQFGMGNIPASKCERVPGAKFNELVLSGKSGLDNEDNVIQYRLGYLGKLHESNQTPTGALTAPTPIPAMFWHITTDDDGTTDVAAGIVKGFELTIRNALLEQWENQYIREPLFNGYTLVQLKLDTEFQARTALDAWLAATQGSPQLVFTSGARSMTIDIGKAYLVESPDHDADGPGVMSQSLTWEAIDDGGSPSTGVAITIVNSQGSGTA